MRISRRVRFESDGPVRPHEFSVLCRLDDGPKTPREVADIERVSAPSMTRTTSALVERGLVARADDPADGRQVILSLTPEGHKVLRGIRRQRDRWMHDRLRDLTPDEQETLTRAAEILQRVAAK
ncbi:MarR family winged helix-turn-helix transcriptional regulator [Nostocoides japonicum]|nr:MarR family transcriptional regulator [Tetrasphaera japonica]